ncbi:hypothetical protein [Streptomyces sp. G-G2]|uniref:hypothetical protein n=1 Tax=Streptomyces sp. G-G2 TaxID=3046201 RepID=UPI0024B9C3F0|nr:hypothetical protein [Streptomyces sp. G-G2]MDJ0383869.1 hypothetical protein [Streptomyces sp. G-G2]
MNRLPRPSTAVLLCACALAAVGGCAAPGGLGPGEPAPAVSAQPRPEPLWPAWTDTTSTAPGAAVGKREPAPQPLKGDLQVPAGGLGAMDVLDVLRADPLMRPYVKGGSINAPGRAGIRPPVHHDLTGNGALELIAAADTASGRSVLAVYTVAGGRIVPVLHTSGLRMEAEAIGTDLLVRTNTNEGIEQAVRFRWDGERMTVVSEEKRYDTSAPRTEPRARNTPAPSAPAPAPSAPAPSPESSR